MTAAPASGRVAGSASEAGDMMPLSYLYGLRRFGQGPGRPRVARYLEAMGNPQRRYPVVQVTGTNGKGSCAAMLAAIAQAAGLRVGLYTSPHFRRFHERMRIDGICINETELRLGVDRLRPRIDAAVGRDLRRRPGGFEAFTLVAADWFARRQVDLVIAEAGIGGLGDATAALEPFFGILTSVDLDHQQVLGSHLPEIARQKVGAWRQGTKAVIGVTQPSIRRCLRQGLRQRGAQVLCLDGEVRAWESEGRFGLRSPFVELSDLPLPLAGAHQVRNAALAATAALWLGRSGFPMEPHHVAEGLKRVRWPGRLEERRFRDVSVLLDAAHNPAAARALAGSLPPGPIHLLAGLSEPHDPGPFLSELKPAVSHATFTRAKHRGLAGDTLARSWVRAGGSQQFYVEEQVGKAVRKAAREALAGKATLLITGSIFLLDEALAEMEAMSDRLDRETP